MVIFDVTGKFNYCEAMLYDNIAAPAVYDEVGSFRDKLLAQKKTGMRIIDIGCAGGHMATDHAKRPSGSMYGIDLSLGLLKKAALRSKKTSANTRLTQASVHALPFKDETFDIVYSTFSIKHWSDKKTGLNECVRILKPGGRLYITELNRDCPADQILRFVRTWRITKFLRPFAAIAFYYFAIRRSLIPEEILFCADKLPLEKIIIETDEGDIYWTIQAIKANNPPE